MKLNDIKNVKSFIVMVDLDGVLADFKSKAEEVVGDVPFKGNVFWKQISAYAATHDFFNAMDWMPDGQQLWEVVTTNFDTYNILSSTGKVPNAQKQKQEWVDNHLGSVKTLFTQNGVDKSKYATPNTILIDDMEKNIKAWIDAGGIGILHTSAADSIKQLQQYIK